MKLLLDQGLPRTATSILAESGHDAIHVADIGHSRTEDKVLLQLARDQGRVVVCLDSDFHKELALGGESTPSVIRLRIEGLRADALANLLIKVLRTCEDDIISGAMVTVEPGSRVRVRRLPIVRPMRS